MIGANATYDVFLSYNSQDQKAVKGIADELTKRGLTVFLDRWYLVPGTPWPEHLERVLSACRSVAIFLGPNGMGRWQQREQYLALDRQAQSSVFPVIPVLLPGSESAHGFLSLNTWIDMRQGLNEDALLLLSSAIKGERPGPDLQRKVATALDSICPYRGLQFFREVDAAFFFGRDAFVDRLISVVNKHQIVAVVGESGSGKSSVVRAGLIPRLRRKGGNKVWDIATMVPGDRPLQNLAAVLVSLLEPNLTEIDRLREVGKLADSFQAGHIKLRDTVSRALEKQPGTDSLMLLVDQWEELYALTRDEQMRHRFIDDLLDATSSGSLSVVLTLRGDFYNHVTAYRPLSDCVQAGIVNISELTGTELRRAIEEPAKKVRLEFESGLVDRILDKVERGSQPMVEFVLMELWNKREDGILTHAAYEKLGKLQGAVAAHAETVFAQFPLAEQVIAQRIFLRLVRPGVESRSSDETAEPTRRRISFAELGQESLPVVRKLADAHLIITGRNEATGEDIIDLVHETLIGNWSRLSSWISDDLSFLTWRERLRTLMSLSARAGRDDSSLLHGALLSEASEWLNKRESDLSDSETMYIRAAFKSQKRLRPVIVTLVALFLAVAGNNLIDFVWRDDNTINFNLNPSASSNSSPPNDSATGFEPSPTPAINLPALRDVKVPNGVVVIPVVVHVVYRRPEENISDSQIKEHIAALNKDFRANNDDLSKVPAPFKEAIADAHIEFVLATTDPQGKATTGVTRTKTSRLFFATGDDVHFRERGGVDAWPSEKYLNIWICHLENDFVGYSSLPGSPNEQDGVVLNYLVFGKLSTTLRRVSTHNIGHYLNLYHLWGEEKDCSGTDFVIDTPPQQGPNLGTPSFPHVTCNNGPYGDMYMNFMDYTDDTYMFTKGQVLRMHQTLQGPRNGLGSLKP